MSRSMARLLRPLGGVNCKSCIFSLCTTPSSNSNMQVKPSRSSSSFDLTSRPKRYDSMERSG